MLKNSQVPVRPLHGSGSQRIHNHFQSLLLLNLICSAVGHVAKHTCSIIQDNHHYTSPWFHGSSPNSREDSKCRVQACHVVANADAVHRSRGNMLALVVGTFIRWKRLKFTDRYLRSPCRPSLSIDHSTSDTDSHDHHSVEVHREGTTVTQSNRLSSHAKDAQSHSLGKTQRRTLCRFTIATYCISPHFLR